MIFNDTATTEIYTLSLHDALPICVVNSLDLNIVNAAFGSRVGQTKYRSEEHTSELQSLRQLVCRLLLEKKELDGDTEEFLACPRKSVCSAGLLRAVRHDVRPTGFF